MSDVKVKVFFSYSHKDEDLRDELDGHLKPLERQDKIETWHDRKIDPGTDWRRELDSQLNSADIILLLVSSNFVSSDFCYCTELEQARKRHDVGEACIIPIFLKPLDLDALEGTPLQTLQGLPEPTKPITKWDDRDEAFVLVARGIRETVNRIQQEKATRKAAQSRELMRQSPLRSRVSDEHYIERDEAKKLLGRFKAALQQPEEHPLLFNICGIGGVGKTTLLGRLQETYADEVDFLGVCFAKTADIETPLKLMRKLHQQAIERMGIQTSTDAFIQREKQFATALFELSHRTLDGGETSSEEARKITSWFERLVWLGTASFTSTSSKPKSYEATAFGEDAEGLQEWVQQRVRNHPATKDQPELQALMLEPVPKLTQAFAESLMQMAQQRGLSLVLILDTYEKAQAYLNQWLWQHLVEDTPLYAAPVRLVVVGRRSLQADEGWRKLNQDRKLLYETQLQRFSRKDTEGYLKQIGIEHGGTRAKIYRATQGLPYYLDWVRKQREEGKELDFSKGNQAIAELLLQGIESSYKRKILQIVACCRWFDLAMLRYLLGCDNLGLQQTPVQAETYFEWLKHSDFVEFTKGRYRLDDVARDVFRQSYFQEDQNQFRKTNASLADYFKQQTNDLFAPQSLLPDPYEDEDWRNLIAEFLYYGLFGKGREGLHLCIEQIFISTYLREPDVFLVPFSSIVAEINKENQKLLSKVTDKFFEDTEVALRWGWFFLDKPPKSYKLKFEGEDNLTEDVIEARLQKIEDSLQALLEHVENLQDGFGKCVGLMYKSLRSNRSGEIVDSLLQAKSQAEQLSNHCHPKLLHSLLSNLSQLLNEIDHHQDALDCCEQALDLWQGNELTFFRKGVALGNLECHEEALESFQKAIDLDPKSVDFWGNRGLALIHLERHEEALESFQKAIDLAPKSVKAWKSRGNTLANLERYEEALESFQKVIDLDPKSVKAWRDLGDSLASLERHEEALESFQKALDLDPKFVDAWSNRGVILQHLKHYEESLAALNRALEIDPESSSLLNSQALTLSFLKNFEKAIATINKAISLEPKEVTLKANRGIILARASRYAEALAECETAIQRDPQHESGYYAKACYYALKGEFEQAIDNLQAVGVDGWESGRVDGWMGEVGGVGEVGEG
jgi:tetratricopeptide (TPR) repeat protein